MPSYRRYVEAQCLRNPCLRDLTKFLATQSADEKLHFESRIASLEFYGPSAPRYEIIDQRDLGQALKKDYKQNKPNGRVLVVENPSANIIETLGSYLNIDPIFFASHLHAPSPNAASQTPQTALLPSQLKDQNFTAHHYHRVLSFDRQVSLTTKLFRKANCPRKVVILPQTRDVCIGIAQHCCSIYQISAGCQPWSYLVLVDPPISDEYLLYEKGSKTVRHVTFPTQLFQGGYEDFQPAKSFSEEDYDRPSTLSRLAMLDDLVHNWRIGLPPHMDVDKTSILDISYFPFRIIAAEWVKYVEVMSLSVKKYEYQVDDIRDLAHVLERFDSDLKALQSWRRRALSSRQKLSSIVQFLRDAKHSTSNHGIVDHLLRDYSYLVSSVESYGKLLESMLPVVTSMVQIVDSRRSFAETANISRLTYLALAFVPLSFISSLFSMSGELAPGGDSFWIYFAVAVPLVVVVFVLARLPLDKMRTSWTDMKKRRTVNRSKTNV